MFKTCPQCQRPEFISENGHRYQCQHCQFTYFHNTAAGVAGIIQCGDKVLFTRRAKHPMLGQLDLPGGFVDHNESLEHALCREVNEELGLDISQWQYFCSSPNTYKYKGVTYKTCDCVFTTRLDSIPQLALQETEIESAIWLTKVDFEPQHMAFDSLKQAICKFWGIQQ